MIKNIAQHIEDNTNWQIGVDLFVGHVPLEVAAGTRPPERYMAVLENASGALEPQLPDRIDKPIQILNRARNYFTARDDAQEIFELWHGQAGIQLPTIQSGDQYLAMVIDAIGSPAPIENPNEQGFFVFSTNYLFRIEEDTC